MTAGRRSGERTLAAQGKRVTSGEKRVRQTLVFACALLLSVLFTLSARAAEEGGASSGVESATELFKWINFAIVLAVFVWVFGKLLPPVFRKKSEAISSAISSAASAKAVADAQLREAETRLANLQKEVAELRAVAEKEAEAEVARLRSATLSDTEKIAAAAKAEIEATERAARLELKALAANLAVDGAESLLVKQLTPKAQESLISNFVKSLEGKPN
jgi:F-type H+-transporting ATPase subunit b